MTDSLSLLAPAKLNLFLHITGRRPDGYHNLQTLFQILDWGDTLTFTPNHSGEITLSGSTFDIAPENNLIHRSAALLQEGDLGVDVHVSKRIPQGGGLGGGSSNAATTLLALNQLWAREQSIEQLQQLGASLGADVPVFVAGHTAWAEGVGDILEAVQLPQSWYVVVAPDCHVSTAEIFSHQQLTRDTSPITIAAFFEGHSRNDCQDLVRNLYPEVDNALKILEKIGSARLTGTGACVFARFAEEAEAREALGRLPTGLNAFMATGVNRSPTFEGLVNN
ncbi:4-(cytidine 5'-diphospho)-2-C-methyl-D-erythritol kinase [Halioglobus maricola]|uniref:4-diphosphocytidyl-2-C-methyl-D-erythritol kinase n=1 Tax=Halioglobus maricola TaxID=2601894 RepID=A0A5P9NH02_9GAMM|nr:4-(cytidine 5'-diphospho)-2-C-methyl-D-erythritol kinase [Halioglobus maricola]QFU74809.1 4-(cytidine 5'-diphospho)-2-C-methyl-D-erythritol kinase [Halioglobus maricola]